MSRSAWSLNGPRTPPDERLAHEDTSTTIENLLDIYKIVNEEDFYGDITKLVNVKIESEGKTKGVIRIYEILVQVNKQLVQKCAGKEPLLRNWALDQCLKATFELAKNILKFFHIFS